MKKLITTTLSLLLFSCIFAQTTFTVNGIKYRTTSTSTVGVTSNATTGINGTYTGSITIPSTVDYSGVNYNVTSIRNGAFSGCTGLTSIVIPSSITLIDSYAFSDCTGLTSIFIPSSVSRSSSDIFYACLNINKIIASAEFIGGLSRLTSISEKLDSIIINSGTLTQGSFDGLPSISRTLRYLDLKESTNTELFDESLNNLYSIENLELPKNLKQILYGEYKECVALKNIFIPASVTLIGKRSFENCRSLKTVTFEANSQLKSIDNWAFYACHDLLSLTIPNGVTTIGDGAFWGCDYLTNVSLPSSVQSISDNGFEGCIGLNKMTVQSSVPPIVFTNTFNKVNKNIPLLVPDASVSLYKSAFGWKDFSNIKGASTELINIEEWNYSISITNKTIEISNATGKSIKVFDVSGRKVYETPNAQTNEQFRINNQGVYIIAIDNLKKKVIVE